MKKIYLVGAVIAVVSFQLFVFSILRGGIPFLEEWRIVSKGFYQGGLVVRESFFKVYAYFASKRTLLEENRRLRMEVGILENENSLLREKIQELEIAVEAQEIEKKVPFEIIPAQVIGSDPEEWLGTLIIDAGERQGVKKGLPVVTYEGLVGRVERVYRGYAVVRTILSSSFAVGVLVQRTREIGVVVGNGSGFCNLEYMPRGAEVQKGDLVITSGIGEGIPRGIVVGRVENVIERPGQLFKEVVLRPNCSFSSLSRVFVVVSEKD